MLQDALLSGKNLPERTLALTFDDGPSAGKGAGTHTIELAKYLRSENISATFFVVGEFAQANAKLLKEMVSLGHLLGNHTFSHPSLTKAVEQTSDGKNVAVDQIVTTNAFIRDAQSSQSILLRPPYGDWSADVAKKLNSDFNIACLNSGPIGWNITGEDYSCWESGMPVDECADRYFRAIYAAWSCSGIVLAHDKTAESPELSRHNQTMIMMQRLIPMLKENGFKFIRCDEIDEVREAMKPRFFKLSLSPDRGPFVGANKDGFLGLTSMDQETLELTSVPVGSSTVAFQTKSGSFLAITGSERPHLVNQPSDAEHFNVASLDNNEIQLSCTATGQYFGFDMNNQPTTTDVSFSVYVKWS